MSSDAIYSNLLYDFVISSANNYKKFGSVELGSVQPVFGITRSGITSGDCKTFSKYILPQYVRLAYNTIGSKATKIYTE